MIPFTSFRHILLLILFLFIESITSSASSDEDEGYYRFLYSSMKKDNEIRRAEHHSHGATHQNGMVKSEPVRLPGDYEPLPGRSSNGDYWPLYPLSNQYHASMTLDPSFSRHVGGDLALPVPYWGFLDISGHFIERVQDYWTKVGYVNNPVNMMGFNKEQLTRMMSDPSLSWNRANQPSLPIASVPRSFVPQSCRPPLCNPYHSNIAVGVETNVHIEDGVEGELDLPIPVGKDIAYRIPISGNFHCDPDDISISYGQNLSPIGPFPLMAGGKSDKKRRRKREAGEGEAVHEMVEHGGGHGEHELESEMESHHGHGGEGEESETEGEGNKRPFLTHGVSNERTRRDIDDKEKEPEYEEEERDDVESGDEKGGGNVYDFLYKRMKQQAVEEPRQRKTPTPNIYMIPGPQEPLPGRSHIGDYWPVFPFQNQFSGGLDLDPSISRHIGGDLNLAVPSWGMLDIYGRFFNRIHDTTTKFGYLNYPVNMLDLEKEDMTRLMSDPSLQLNRNNQPRLPLGKLAKSYVPVNCKAPMCNPYHANFAFGVEQDYGGNDGVEGDIDVPVPIGKGIAYRLPISGKIYSFFDNVTITYGQNLAPIDPYHSLFDYQKYRDPRLAIPRRRKREISESVKVWQSEPDSSSFVDHLKSGGTPKNRVFRSIIPKERSPKFDQMDAGQLQYITVKRSQLPYFMTQLSNPYSFSFMASSPYYSTPYMMSSLSNSLQSFPYGAEYCKIRNSPTTMTREYQNTYISRNGYP